MSRRIPAHGGAAPRPRRAVILVVFAAALAVTGLGTFAAIHLRASADSTAAGQPPSHPPSPQSHPASPPSTPSTHSPSPHPSSRRPAQPRPRPLAGKVIGIDPGHNGGNGADPGYINQPIWNGRETETCDTTGTETDAGYTEAQFNFDVALYLRADLVSAGARVVMTRTSNDGVGPCVNTRAQILNNAHPDVAIDIHADGGPAWGRGFTVLEPVADGPNNQVIGSSELFGSDVKQEMLRDTPMPVSNYYGTGGVQFRDDLAGLNLATEPKILIESGNMRNAVDAGLLTSAAFQKQLARAFAAAITLFLSRP
ncbi:MAG TPA: N-acetylmuramoyl-L-alanine amidase [Streptosporangiaceae bacterium]|jgi:N-acetylmuramoyl-L-alanine amidase|nr:N-acetylmuramoyl-L-alanine amidase [Streptosporangiaceae bacterium]